jgi:hypothetical protein
MPAVLPASRGVRVAGEVLVVPPFECAWLSGEGSEPSGDGGSVSFEAKGQSDVTVMLKPRGAPTRRLDHWSGRLDGAAASDEHAYLVIIGSHRNSCLCIERDGVVAHLVKGEWLPKDAPDAFTKYRVSWTADGRISVVVGGPNAHRVHRWRDPEPFRDVKIECVGLSTWDGFTQYRNIRLAPLGRRHHATANPDDPPRDARRENLVASRYHARLALRSRRESEREGRAGMHEVADAVVVVRRRVVARERPADEETETEESARVEAGPDPDADADVVDARVIAGAPEDIFAAAPVDARRAHAALLAAASPLLRRRLAEAAKTFRRRSVSSVCRSPSAEDIAVALGGGGGGGGGAGPRADPLDAPLGYPRVCYLVVVELNSDDGSSSRASAVDSFSFLGRASLAWASRSPSATRRALLRFPPPPELSDFVVAVATSCASESEEASRASGAPTTTSSSSSSSSPGGSSLEFHAHRVSLAANSAFFRRMFASGMRESAAGRLDLPADAAASPAAIAAFVRFARTGAFPAGAPAAEVLSLCRRFGADAATRAACRAVEEARDDGADAMTLLAVAQDLGVDLARVLEDEDEETDEEEDEDEDEEVEEEEKNADAEETRKQKKRGRIIGESRRHRSSVVVDGAGTIGLDDSNSDSDSDSDDGDESDSEGGADRALARLFRGCAHSVASRLVPAAEESPEAFAALPLAALCAILSRDALEVPDEDAALTLALRWCEGKTTEEAAEALSRVRFPRISRAGVEAAKASPAFAASAAVRALVDEAIAASSGGEEGDEEGRIVDDGGCVDGGGGARGSASVPVFASPSAPASFPLSPRRAMAVSTDGSSVSLALRASDRRAAARATPRASHGANLVFVREGDGAGVFGHIGRKGGASQWTNPVQSGEVVVTASSPVCRFTDPATVVSGEFARVSFAGPPSRTGAGTGTGAAPWWAVDLGARRRLRCDHYAVRQDGSSCFPRHWELQGSVEGGEDESSWITLRRHAGDATVCRPGAWGSWAVPPPGSARPVRFLRLRLTGPTGGSAEGEGDAGAEHFHLCSLEFYGLLATVTDVAAR